MNFRLYAVEKNFRRCVSLNFRLYAVKKFLGGTKYDGKRWTSDKVHKVHKIPKKLVLDNISVVR